MWLLTTSVAPCGGSFPSLFQKPPGGERLGDEQAAFSRSLTVMGDLYASAIGTTVLQLKEIPPRPADYPLDAVYNQTPYDERGWCCCEDSVSREVINAPIATTWCTQKMSALPLSK